MMDILNYHTTRNCHCVLTVTAGQGETAAVSDWDKQCACSTIDGDAGAHQCSVRAPLADTHHVVGKAARFTFSKEPTNHSLSMCNAVRVESTQCNCSMANQCSCSVARHFIHPRPSSCWATNHTTSCMPLPQYHEIYEGTNTCNAHTVKIRLSPAGQSPSTKCYHCRCLRIPGPGQMIHREGPPSPSHQAHARRHTSAVPLAPNPTTPTMS